MQKQWLEVGENVPAGGNRVSRAIGRAGLRLIGWRVAGELPNVKQLVICGAPHTSNWDFVVAMLVELALGIKFSYLMKKEAFIWPFKSLFMALGGIPLNRGGASDVVKQIAGWYATHDKVWLAITPEGTRAKVDKWKTGFLRIAREADVPVMLAAFHYPEKTLYLDKVWYASGDHVADAEAIREYTIGKFQGAFPEKQ